MNDSGGSECCAKWIGGIAGRSEPTMMIMVIVMMATVMMMMTVVVMTMMSDYIGAAGYYSTGSCSLQTSVLCFFDVEIFTW